MITSTTVPASVVPGTYQWFRNSSTMTGQNTDFLVPNNIGNYSLTYSFGGCSNSSNIFAVNPTPIVAGIDKTNCVNNMTVLSTSNVSGGSVFSYNWNPDPTIIGATNTSQITVQTNLAFDTIGYVVNVSNEFACSAADSVFLISIAQPLMTLVNDTLCQGQTVLLDATPTNFGVGTIPPIEDYFPTYTWTKDGVNLNHNNKTLLATSEGEYIVNISIGDCNNNKDTASILFNRFAQTNLPEKTKFCVDKDSAVTLNATAKPMAGFTFTYSWSPTSETTPKIEVNKEGLYIVTITSTIGSNSCPIDDSIQVNNICPPRVFVPNVITPDKDGDNKNFKIYGGHYTDFSITVFSRWGEVVFFSEDLEFMKTVGWDGTYKNTPMPQGVYSWIIKYNGESEEYEGPYKKEGEILIIR